MLDKADSIWEPCSSGSIDEMVSLITTRRRRLQTARMSVKTIAFFGIGLAVWSFRTRPVEYNYGGIVCGEVRRLAPVFLSGKLDNDTSRKIVVHLGLCLTCGSTMQKTHESVDTELRPGCEHCSQRAALAAVEDVQTDMTNR